jgi:hypothetical protein
VEDRRRSALVAVVLAAIMSGCAAPGFYEPPVGAPAGPGGPGGPGASGDPGASAAPGAEGRTAWENVVAGVERDGTVPLETALQAFSIAFGTTLPGVELPTGTPGFYGSATGPVSWLVGHWDELTPEQQAAALPYFDPNTPPPAAAASPAGGLLAADTPGWPAAPVPDAVPAVEDFIALADSIAPQIAAKLPKGRKLKIPYEVVFRDLPVKEGTVVMAETVIVDENGSFAKRSSQRATKCLIQINTRGQGLISDDQTAVVAHELFHCYQYDLATRIADIFDVPPWIDEGGAAWVGEDFTSSEIGSTLGQQYWLGWLKEPDGFLFHRGYDAIGWYAHLARVGADPWKVLDSMYLTAMKTKSSFDAYDVAMKLGGDKAIDAWGTSYFRDDGIGGDWTMAGKGLPTNITTPIPQGPLASEDTIVMVVLPTTAWAVKVDIQASVFAIVGPSARGQIRFSDGTTRTLSAALGEAFCTRPEGCTCPESSPGSAFSFQPAPKGVALLGFTGHTDGLDLDLVGLGAETACEKDPGSFHVPEPCYCAGALPGAIRPDA